jgi:hypothetical protein
MIPSAAHARSVGPRAKHEKGTGQAVVDRLHCYALDMRRGRAAEELPI